MVMHIGGHLAGPGIAFLEEPEAPSPWPQPAGVEPAADGPQPETVAPSTWLQDLPPPDLHAGVGQTQPDWGEPLTHNALHDLAPAAVNVPAPSEPPVAQVANEPAATATAETPVSPEWLQQREAALLALRADYTSTRDAALASQGAGPGWVPAAMTTDDSGRPVSANGAPIVFVPDPLAEPPENGNPDDGPAPLAGRYLEFSEAAFAAHFLADVARECGEENEGDVAWKTLARLYDTDAATLATRHPGLLDLALTEHAINAGPPPPGHAMGSVQQLGITDLVLADPLMREIAQSFGRAPDAPTSALALEQVRLYGQARYEQMTRLHIGMESVRDQYSAALDQASRAAGGPGWVDVQVQRQETSHSVQGDNDVFDTRSVSVTERRFDPDAFTRWYNTQDGLANRAFAQLYGNSHTEYLAPLRRRGEDVAPAGPPTVGRIRFDNAPWHIAGLGNPMRRDGLIGLDLNTAPRMHNDAAVGFDFELGWATSPENIVDKPSTGQQLAQLAVVVAVSYFTWNPVNAWASASSGLGLGTTGAAAVAGAAAAAASSLASGVMNGNVDFKNIVRSAFSAALTAGLMGGANQLGLLSTGGRVGETLVRMTVQGGVQALMGGEFKDGAAMAFASGLAQAVGEHLNTAIAQSLPADQVSAAQTAVRVVTSAIRALGNPDDPLSAFASSFLNDVLQDSGLAAGATSPVVAGAAGPTGHAAATLQAQALAEELMDQGYTPDDAAAEAMRRVGVTLSPSSGAAGPGAAALDPGSAGVVSLAPIEINGGLLPQDRYGNRYQVDADGRALVTLASGGVLGLQPQALVVVNGVVQLTTALVREFAAVARNPVLAIGTLVTAPGNFGPDVQIVDVGNGVAFQHRPGEAWGQKLERNEAGQWEVVAERAIGIPTQMGFRVLTEEEVARQQIPTSLPAGSPLPQIPPLPAWAERVEVLPPFLVVAPAPGVPGLEAAPQPSADDLIIQRDQEEQRRFRGRVIGEAFGLDPNFDPSLYEAHHVVPLNEYPDLQPLRDRFEVWEIDLNDLANGVPLPREAGVGQGTPHRATQNSPVYQDELLRRFDEVQTRDEALAVLSQIKNELRNDTFFARRAGNP